MTVIRYLTAILALSISSFSFSDSIEFSGVYIEGTHKITTPYSGLFVAPNNELHDMSKFYENSGLLLHGQFVASKRFNKTGTFYIPVFFDVGYNSILYKAEPFISMGVLFQTNLSDTTSIIVEARNVAQVGGYISERPCIDEFDRDFHCGTGRPWGDRPQLKASLPSILSINIRGSF